MSDEGNQSAEWVVEVRRAFSNYITTNHVHILSDVFNIDQAAAFEVFQEALRLAHSYRGKVILETDAETAQSLTKQANDAIDGLERRDPESAPYYRMVCFTCRPKVEPQPSGPTRP